MKTMHQAALFNVRRFFVAAGGQGFGYPIRDMQARIRLSLFADLSDRENSDTTVHHTFLQNSTVAQGGIAFDS